MSDSLLKNDQRDLKAVFVSFHGPCYMKKKLKKTVEMQAGKQLHQFYFKVTKFIFLKQTRLLMQTSSKMMTHRTVCFFFVSYITYQH